MIYLRLAEITKIWREKVLYPKHDGTLGALIPFEVADVIKINSMYLLQINILMLFLIKWRTYPVHFWFQQIYDDLFLKYEEKLNWEDEINNEQNNDSLNFVFIIIDL